MKTFHEWLEERHPELLDEWLRDLANNRTVRNLVTGLALTAGAAGFAGRASGGEASHKPVATAQDSQSVTSEAEYDFDDNESIRDAVEEATMKAKAEIAKMYGKDSLSGVGRPTVRVDRKARKVFVTVAVPKQARGSAPAPKLPSKNSPSVQKRVSRSDF